jgi:uncharacterized protein (TIGR02757 family)
MTGWELSMNSSRLRSRIIPDLSQTGSMVNNHHLKEFLDEKVRFYNRPSFIESDPIYIPHLFRRKQDIEIAGLFAAVFAWGQRKTIIKKCKELLSLMDNAPYDFICHHTGGDLSPFKIFRHRTFNATDTLYFIHFLKMYYSEHDSLEYLFTPPTQPTQTLSAITIQGNPVHSKIRQEPVEAALINFHAVFFNLPEAPDRTRKHIPTPARKSTCKRLNMYLRWMVREDRQGVDFGIWKKIKMKDLICPVDIHVDRIARQLSLINRKQTDWATALELTWNLRNLDPEDPVKYDYALFGMGVLEGKLLP